MADDQAPATAEEIHAIAVRVLKEAPPGEFDECVYALKGFVPDTAAVDSAAHESYRIWAQNRVIPVTVGDDNHKALICKEANLGGDKYIDPTTSKSFTYDFDNKRTVTPKPPAPPPEPEVAPEDPLAEGDGGELGPEVPEVPQVDEEAALSEEKIPSTPLRDATQATLEKFTGLSIANGTCGVYDKDGGLAIVISGSSISKENFRCGSVIFHFTYKSGVLNGTIGFYAHFFENGNAVTHQDGSFSTKIKGGDDTAVAAQIGNQLATFYTDWIKKIQAGFELLSDEGLNKLRRRLPITKTHINWQQELYGGAAMQTKK